MSKKKKDPSEAPLDFLKAVMEGKSVKVVRKDTKPVGKSYNQEVAERYDEDLKPIHKAKGQIPRTEILIEE